MSKPLPTHKITSVTTPAEYIRAGNRLMRQRQGRTGHDEVPRFVLLWATAWLMRLVGLGLIVGMAIGGCSELATYVRQHGWMR